MRKKNREKSAIAPKPHPSHVNKKLVIGAICGLIIIVGVLVVAVLPGSSPGKDANPSGGVTQEDEQQATSVGFSNLLTSPSSYLNQYIKTNAKLGILQEDALTLEPSRAFLYSPGDTGQIYLLPSLVDKTQEFYDNIAPQITDNIEIIGILKTVTNDNVDFFYLEVNY